MELVTEKPGIYLQAEVYKMIGTDISTSTICNFFCIRVDLHIGNLLIELRDRGMTS